VRAEVEDSSLLEGTADLEALECALVTCGLCRIVKVLYLFVWYKNLLNKLTVACSPAVELSSYRVKYFNFSRGKQETLLRTSPILYVENFSLYTKEDKYANCFQNVEILSG
jgi:hypothetical protein